MEACPPRRAPVPCVVCGEPTLWRCADCALDGRGAVAVCISRPCRDVHARTCGAPA